MSTSTVISNKYSLVLFDIELIDWIVISVLDVLEITSNNMFLFSFALTNKVVKYFLLILAFHFTEINLSSSSLTLGHTALWTVIPWPFVI